MKNDMVKSKVMMKKGAWTKEEDIMLEKCIQKHGEGKWHLVPSRAALNRCRKSCRLRWLNYLKPDIKKGQFTEDEVDLILRLHKLLGNRWSLIAGRIPGRTANDIKNYWNTHFRKKINISPNQPFQNHKTDGKMSQYSNSNNGVIKCLPRKFSKQSNNINGDIIIDTNISYNKDDVTFAPPPPPTPPPKDSSEVELRNGVMDWLEIGLDLDVWNILVDEGENPMETLLVDKRSSPRSDFELDLNLWESDL